MRPRDGEGGLETLHDRQSVWEKPGGTEGPDPPTAGNTTDREPCDPSAWRRPREWPAASSGF